MYRETVDGIGVFLDKTMQKYFDPVRFKAVLNKIYQEAGVDVGTELDKTIAGYCKSNDDFFEYYKRKLSKMTYDVRLSLTQAQKYDKLASWLPNSLEDLVLRKSNDLLECSNPCGCPIIYLPKGYPWECKQYPQDLAEVNNLFLTALSVVFDVNDTIINDVLDLDIHEIEC